MLRMREGGQMRNGLVCLNVVQHVGESLLKIGDVEFENIINDLHHIIVLIRQSEMWLSSGVGLLSVLHGGQVRRELGWRRASVLGHDVVQVCDAMLLRGHAGKHMNDREAVVRMGMGVAVGIVRVRRLHKRRGRRRVMKLDVVGASLWYQRLDMRNVMHDVRHVRGVCLPGGVINDGRVSRAAPADAGQLRTVEVEVREVWAKVGGEDAQDVRGEMLAE